MPEQTPMKGQLTALQQAGVENRSFKTSTLMLEELSRVSLIRLHSLINQPQLDSRLPLLPAQTGQCAGEDPAALCLRPGEWILVSATRSPSELLSGVMGAVHEGQTTANNQSDGLAVFRLSGPGAPWLLSKLSSLDFLAGVDHGVHCARTKIGHVAAIVHYHQSPEGRFLFDLLFDRSIAKYLWTLLTESAAHADELAKTFSNSS